MGKWCETRKKYLSNFDLLRDEINKESLDKKEINSLMFKIETSYQEKEDEIDNLEDNIYDLERNISSLEDEIDWFNKRESNLDNPSILDSYFKRKIFENLNKKYTWFELEEKLKDLI